MVDDPVHQAKIKFAADHEMAGMPGPMYFSVTAISRDGRFGNVLGRRSQSVNTLGTERDWDLPSTAER